MKARTRYWRSPADTKRKWHTDRAIVIDFFHWTEQGNWEFDPEYWPDPKADV